MHFSVISPIVFNYIQIVLRRFICCLGKLPRVIDARTLAFQFCEGNLFIAIQNMHSRIYRWKRKISAWCSEFTLPSKPHVCNRFPHNWPIVGNPPTTLSYPCEGPVMMSCDVLLLFALISGWPDSGLSVIWNSMTLMWPHCDTDLTNNARTWYDSFWWYLKRPWIIVFIMTDWTSRHSSSTKIYPASKVHGTNMGPTWVLSAPDGPHVGPRNLAIRVSAISVKTSLQYKIIWNFSPTKW